MKRLAQLNSVLFCFLLFVDEVFARAGGGISGGGTGGGVGAGPRGGGISGALLLCAALLFFFAVGLYAWRRPKKLKATQELLETLGKVDPMWEEGRIRTYVKDHFLKTQEAWSSNDLATLKILLDSKLFSRWEKKIRKMSARGERNRISGLEIFHMDFIDIRNYLDDEKDRFTVEICACCMDETLNKSGEILKSNLSTFTEYWSYSYFEARFVLSDVSQRDGDLRFLMPNLNEAPIN